MTRGSVYYQTHPGKPLSNKNEWLVDSTSHRLIKPDDEFVLDSEFEHDIEITSASNLDHLLFTGLMLISFAFLMFLIGIMI